MNQTAKRAAAPNKVKKKAKTSPIIYVLIVVLFIALLAFFYYMAVRYYTDRFPNKTFINSVDVSNMTAENAKAALNDHVLSYELTIQERGDVTETIKADQIGLGYSDNGDVDRLLEQYAPAGWILHYFTKDQLQAAEDTDFDQAMLDQRVAELNCFDPASVTPVEDACIAKNTDGFYIKAEVTGNELDQDKTTELIKEALASGLDQINLEENDCYLAPQILQDDETLTTELTKLNKWTSAEITYDFEDDRLEVADTETIMSWVVEQDDGTYDIDRDLVYEWVKTTLAYKYDTFGLTHVVTTHSGETITLKGGDYGWCIARDDTTDALIAAVKEGTVGELEPAYLYTAQNRGIDDIGGTYVEISIAAQTMWCYKDYELVVETPVVTGNPNKGNATPSGSVWAFDCHKSPATLGTLDTMGYSSDVTYWMSFTGNVGIHDATWRSTFGGNIYTSNGSHGCVNTPYEAAKTIYNTVNVGYPVFVY